MKVFKVTASQLVYYTKTVEAETQEQAEALAWEYDKGNDWKEVQYGDWQLEGIEESEEVIEPSDDTYDEYGVNTKNSFNTPPKGESK